MSFSCGNFVTLTNLSDEGLDRIIRLKLSPLYLSVHTMNPALRVKLLRNRFAGKIVEQVKKLAENGIEVARACEMF
jgi:NifB/MoaA-like Fe-S oxidoreductase